MRAEMTSTDTGITVDLGGEALDPQAVADAIEQVTALVSSIRGAEDARMTLTDLHGGSAHITMKVAGSSLDLVHDGIEELRLAPVLPQAWGRATLKAVVGLAKVSRLRGVEDISLRIGDAVSVIDAAIRENAEKALTPSSRSLGSVRGQLYRYTNDTGRSRHYRSAALRRAGTDQSIELKFAPEDAGEIRALLDREVEVWGEIARDATGEIAHLSVEGLEAVDDARAAMTIADGRGLLGEDWLGGADPAEWVRAYRDGRGEEVEDDPWLKS